MNNLKIKISTFSYTFYFVFLLVIFIRNTLLSSTKLDGFKDRLLLWKHSLHQTYRSRQPNFRFESYSSKPYFAMLCPHVTENLFLAM